MHYLNLSRIDLIITDLTDKLLDNFILIVEGNRNKKYKLIKNRNDVWYNNSPKTFLKIIDDQIDLNGLELYFKPKEIEENSFKVYLKFSLLIGDTIYVPVKKNIQEVFQEQKENGFVSFKAVFNQRILY